MRHITVVIVFAVAALPAFLHAQAEEPSECTTTTTVRCTGAAAPYGVPPAAQPTAPAYPPAPGYAPPPPVLLDLRALEHDNWHLVQHGDGTLWRERKVSTASPALWGSGLALLAGGWLAAGAYSVYDSGNGVPGLPFAPVIGSWVQAAIIGTADNSHGGLAAFYGIDGLLQAGGLVMLLVGLAAGPSKVERMPVMIGGAAISGGGGLSLSGRF